jgi:hypothetical protein
MCRRLQFGLLLLAVCSVLNAQMTRTLPGAPITDGTARVLELTGQVSVLRNGDLWALLPNGTVTPGQEIVSGPDGHAMLEVSDGSHVEVFPNSHLLFRANRTSLRDLLDVILGKVRIHIEKLGGQPNPYKVTSPTAFIAVRGTTFEVTVDASETTMVAVEEGRVEVYHRLSGSNKSVVLNPGYSVTVFKNEPLAESHVDRVRTLTKAIDQVAERAMAVIRQTGVIKPPTGTVPTTTPTSTTPTATPGSTTGAGTGTTTPPTNGRQGSGPGTTTPGTGTGTGTTTPPGTGTGTGNGSSGGGGGTGPTSTSKRTAGN